MTVMYMAVARAVTSCTRGVRQNTAGSSCHTTTAGTMRQAARSEWSLKSRSSHSMSVCEANFTASGTSTRRHTA